MSHSYDVYCTDLGDVRVSEREMGALQLAAKIRAEPRMARDPHWARFLEKAASIEAACNKFAQWQHDHARA